VIGWAATIHPIERGEPQIVEPHTSAFLVAEIAIHEPADCRKSDSISEPMRELRLIDDPAWRGAKIAWRGAKIVVHMPHG
jgi:hypothetical protein